jgi:hypothetical protein
MAKIQVIRKGESLPFSFNLGTTDTAGYVCTITVRQYPANAASISRVVESTVDATTGQTVWAGFLTATETAALDVGMWVLNANLVKASTVEQTDIPVRFQITPNWTT